MFKKQLQYFPDDVAILNSIAMAQLNQGKYLEALSNMNHVIQLMPDSGPAYLNLAIIYENLGDHRKAVQMFVNAYNKLGRHIIE